MSYADKFFRDAARRNIVNNTAQKGPAILLGTGAASSAEQERILNLHVDNRFWNPLYRTDGVRVYPAGYAGAGEGPVA